MVQILDRKNMELEEVKSHYRNKITEMEAAAKKQERKGEERSNTCSQNNTMTLKVKHPYFPCCS